MKDALLIDVFIPIAVVSITGSLFVCLNLLCYGARTVSSRLVLYLNLSVILDELCSLPLVFLGDSSMCKTAAFLKAYAELLNVFLCVLLASMAYNVTFPFTIHAPRITLSVSTLAFIFGSPLFLLLAFATDSYGVYEEYWCSFTDSPAGNVWYMGLLVLNLLLVAFTAGVVLVTAYRMSYLNGRVNLLIKGVGLYSVVAVVCWLPKLLTLQRLYITVTVSESVYIFVARLFTYIAGILYTLVFLLERNSLRMCRSCVVPLGNTEESSEFIHSDCPSFYDEYSVHGRGDVNSVSFSRDYVSVSSDREGPLLSGFTWGYTGH